MKKDMNSPRKILVIDDDPLVLRSVGHILKKANYLAELASNSDEALKKAEVHSFDLVISDIQMPGKNGVEAIREIRKLFNEKIKRDVPIIFITGYAQIGLELDAKHLGEVILKPFDLNQLVMTIREYL